MAVLFFLCMAVQFNDPDPLRWMALYGLAGLSCCLSHFGRLPRFIALALALLSFAWAGLLSVRVLGKVSPSDLFASFEMAGLAVEEAREMIGLVLSGCWMILLTFVSGRPGSTHSN